MRSFFIETWGCQMNHHDSERLEGQLRRHGLEPASEAGDADLVLLNTCSVRERPVRKIASRIGELGRHSPPPMVGVCGCVAEQEGQALLERSPLVRFVLGPGQVGRLGEALQAVARGERPLLIGFDPAARPDEHDAVRRSRTRGMITVVEGCDEFCTFCVVPYTRGRERSRPMGEILDEARGLVASGLREVELLGQTINSYCCPSSGAGFAALLDAVADVQGLERVRYVTSHPRHFSDELIEVLARRRSVSLRLMVTLSDSPQRMKSLDRRPMNRASGMAMRRDS